MIKKFISFYDEKLLPFFIVFENASKEFVGRIGFGVTENQEIEFGYLLHKKFWGQDASEALLALLEYAKKYVPAKEIIAFANSDNIASTRVMEKSGMQYYKTDITQGIECKFYRISNIKLEY